MAPERKVDNCFCFHLVICGAAGLGKTTLVQRLKRVKSFEKLLAQGASTAAQIPPLDEIDAHPTSFVETTSLELPVSKCSELNRHRTYFYEAPSDKPVLRDGLINQTSIGLMDGVVLMVDGTLRGQHESVQHVLDLCVKNNVHLLIVNFGTPLGDAQYQHPLVRLLVCEREDFVQITVGVLGFMDHLHNYRSNEEAEGLRVAELLKEQELEAAKRRHPLSLPCREVPYTWQDHHAPDNEVDMSLNMLLFGAPNTGKTTFATSLLDGFTIRQHDPTKSLEQGTFHVELANKRINVSLYDGPGVNSVQLGALGVLFVDVSSPTGLEDANRILLGIRLPPTMVVVATKNDLGSLADPIALRDFAGGIPSYLCEADPRKIQQDLVARMLLSIVDAEAAAKQDAHRSQVLHTLRNRKEEVDVPTDPERLHALFQRYDLDGNGTIDVHEAEILFEEFNKAGFGNCKEALARIMKHSAITSDATRITYDQFCMLMCHLVQL